MVKVKYERGGIVCPSFHIFKSYPQKEDRPCLALIKLYLFKLLKNLTHIAGIAD